MKKAFIYLILMTTILWLVLFLFAYKKYQFGTDAIWKVEQQRREHVYLFPFIAKFIHNKGFYFSYSVFENYLSYYSPSTFFCCNQPLILELITLLTFYGGVLILLKTSTTIELVMLSWILVYPIFLSPALLSPSLLLLLPLVIPTTGFFIYTLYRSLKFKLK